MNIDSRGKLNKKNITIRRKTTDMRKKYGIRLRQKIQQNIKIYITQQMLLSSVFENFRKNVYN